MFFCAGSHPRSHVTFICPVSLSSSRLCLTFHCSGLPARSTGQVFLCCPSAGICLMSPPVSTGVWGVGKEDHRDRVPSHLIVSRDRAPIEGSLPHSSCCALFGRKPLCTVHTVGQGADGRAWCQLGPSAWGSSSSLVRVWAQHAWCTLVMTQRPVTCQPSFSHQEPLLPGPSDLTRHAGSWLRMVSSSTF